VSLRTVVEPVIKRCWDLHCRYAGHPGDRVFVPPEWPYKSPDELVDGICTLHTDVYSFGCTVYAVGVLFHQIVRPFDAAAS